ncbi:MAG: MOSC domain-containing protein YiiM [Paraglaciecola sp.]
MKVNPFGIVGDVQVDKRLHGGTYKALHRNAQIGYVRIIKRYPLLHKKARSGNIGDNISATGMHAHSVYIGQAYQLGEVNAPLSSPRITCWKIDEEFKQPDLYHPSLICDQLTRCW